MPKEGVAASTFVNVLDIDFWTTKALEKALEPATRQTRVGENLM